MEDHDTKNDKVDELDPIVMYFIVNETLEMSTGKTSAQVGHACQMLLMQHFNDVQCVSLMSDDGLNLFNKRSEAFDKWLQSSFRKVVLKADLKEWKKVKEHYQFSGEMVLVIDNGLTEIPSGSETVIGLFPMKKSERPKLIKRLQVLV